MSFPVSNRSTATYWVPIWPQSPTPESTASSSRSHRQPVRASHGWEASTCRCEFMKKYYLSQSRSRLGPGPKDSRLTHESHTSLYSCSLSLRASGCGLTVKVSITPIGTYLIPPAATLASTYAPPVSPSVSFVWGAPSASL